MTLAESIDEPPPTGTTIVSSGPEGRERLTAPLGSMPRPGSARPRRRQPDGDAGRLEHVAHPIDDARARARPGR